MEQQSKEINTTYDYEGKNKQTQYKLSNIPNSEKLHTIEILLQLFNKMKDDDNKEEMLDCLLILERLLYLSIYYLNDQGDSLPLNFSEFLEKFISLIFSNINDSMNKQNIKGMNIITKAIDILFNPILKNFDEKQLTASNKSNLQILTLNKLSQIYRTKKLNLQAIKVLEQSAEIGQQSLKSGQNIKILINSIEAYLTASSLFSELGKHQKAIESIKSSIQLIDKFKKQNENSQKSNDKTLQSYEMIAYYNLGAEHEHLQILDISIESYQLAFDLAKKLQNRDLQKSCETAIKKLKILQSASGSTK